MNTEKYFRVLKYEKSGQVKTDLLLQSLADSTIEKKKLGFDRMGAPDLEILRRRIGKNERFIISVFNKKLPEIGSLVNSDYIKEQATRAFFDQASSFSGKPVRSFGPLL